MKRIKHILFILPALIAIFLIAPKAKAQDFNVQNNRGITNWAARTGPVKITNQISSTAGGTTSTVNIDANFCAENLFKFQTNNLFVGTFCDLGNIVAISAADFATNATCTIQKVAMNNYDSSITFRTRSQGTGATSLTGSNNFCVADHEGTPLFNGTTDPNIFGQGTAAGSATGTTTSNGLFQAAAVSQMTNDINPKPNASGQKESWIWNGYALVRNFATIAALVALMIFAFANILHLDINTYTIKKMIPNIIIAVVGAYLSIYAIYLLSRGIDFLYRLQFFSPYNTLHPFYNIMGGNFESVITNADSQQFGSLGLIFSIGGQFFGSGASASIISGILGVIFISIPAVIVFAFEYALALRPIAVGLLTICAPLAFAAYVFPVGQNIFKKWVTITIIALFYLPVVNMIFYIMNQLPVATGGASLIFILMVLVKSAVLVLLIRLPFTIETDIQKISLALGKTDFGASLGLGKATTNVKVKQQNNPVADRILASKAAKSLIAPVSGSTYRRDITQSKIGSDRRNNISELRQLVSRSSQPLINNLREVSEKAHKTNLARSGQLLVNSIADLSPQALHKIVNSSNRSIFSDKTLVNELKAKNGQILDDEGAATRSDAVKKIFKLSQMISANGRLTNPEAIKLISNKQMLGSLPQPTLKKAVEQGIIGKADLQANFKAPPEQVINYLAKLNPSGRPLDTKTIQTEIEKDYHDSKTGFTDLLTALSANQEASGINNNTARILETIKNSNQTEFDQNGMYYLGRLNEINTDSKKKLEVSLKQAGTPIQTAMAISQNPGLSYEQIISYVPKSSSTQTLSTIREIVGQRDTSQNLIGQISSSLKEDKVALGRNVAEKVSESLNKGNSRTFDDVKTQISSAIKNLEPGASPDTVKSSLATINNFASGSAMQVGAINQNDIDQAKEKGQAVLSTIDEMKMSGINEKAVAENPTAVAQSMQAKTAQVIDSVASGKSKPSQPAANALEKDQLPTDQLPANQTKSTISDQIAGMASGQNLTATTAKEGKSFDQQLGDIAQKTPEQGKSKTAVEPTTGAANG